MKPGVAEIIAQFLKDEGFVEWFHEGYSAAERLLDTLAVRELELSPMDATTPLPWRAAGKRTHHIDGADGSHVATFNERGDRDLVLSLVSRP